MLISDIFGHERVKDVLYRAHSENRIGHAYIFEGPEGVGRLTMAKAFANLLVCTDINGGNVCQKCKACSMADSGNHPDIRIITNQLYDESKKSKDILVDTVRNMKQEIYILLIELNQSALFQNFIVRKIFIYHICGMLQKCFCF